MDPAMMQNSKKLLNNFKDIRKDLYATQGPGRKKHVQTWVGNVTQLDQSLQKEMSQVRNVHVADHTGKGDSGLKQDPFQTIFDRLRNEISEMIDKNASLILNLPRVKGAPINYKLTEKEHKLLWRKENSLLKQKTNELLNQMNMSVDDKFVIIGKLLNLKDNIQHQLFQGISYQKMVTWLDLNIKLQPSADSDEIYDHSKAVELHKRIAQYMETQKFLPRQLPIELFDLDNQSGPYTGENTTQYDTVETIVCLNNQFTDMMQLIKTSFLFSDDKKDQFRTNNTVQQTLRQDLEDMHMQMNEQKEQFRRLQEQLSKNDSSSKGQEDDLAKINKELEQKCIILDEALDNERTKLKETTSKFMDLKRKHKQLDEVHNKIKNSVIPKVAATKDYHKELSGHISQIREDSAMLPDMFRQLVIDSNELAKEKDEAIKSRDFALQSDRLLRKQVKNLSEELDRKRRLAMQAIAARSGIKGELEDQKKKLIEYESSIDDIRLQVEEAKAERDRYAQKHDEMFNSVSNLNSRIEELEQHKLHLLKTLKTKYNDKGGLDYIIKTQNLEGIKGKEFKDKVQVEDYKPEDKRAERDADYAKRKAEDDADKENSNH